MLQSWSIELPDWSGLMPHPALIIYFLIFLPCAITTVSDSAVQNFEFPAYRLQQYDVAGSIYGSRHSAVNCEAASIAGASSSLRKCLILTWNDLLAAASNLDSIVNDNHGAIIVLMPSFDSVTLNKQAKEKIYEVEKLLLSQAYQIPIYFTRESETLQTVLKTLEKTSTVSSAFSALMDGIVANAYQVVSISAPNPVPMTMMHNIVAKLESSPNAPTIVVVAYYDSFAVAPAYATGSESNGSGVAALLELVRVLRKLYASPSTKPQYNVMALLSAGGKFGYQGSRYFIENYWKLVNGGSNTDAGPIQFALCLDSIAGNQMYLHVSKAPTPESNTGKFHHKINAVASKFQSSAPKSPTSDVTTSEIIPIVARKINLGDTMRAWEHERYNMERLPAFTLSSIADPQDPVRRTLLDQWNKQTVSNIVKNTQTIADTIVHYLYSTEPETDAIESLSASINEDAISGWMERLTSKPRAAQTFISERTSPTSPLLKDFHASLSSLAHSVHYQVFAANNKDTDITVYTVADATLSIYNVKPAVFDLVLGLAIGGYLALLHQAILNIEIVLATTRSIFASSSKQNGYANGKAH